MVPLHSAFYRIVYGKFLGDILRKKLQVILGAFKKYIVYDIRRNLVQPGSVFFIVLTVSVLDPEFIGIDDHNTDT